MGGDTKRYISTFKDPIEIVYETEYRPWRDNYITTVWEERGSPYPDVTVKIRNRFGDELTVCPYTGLIKERGNVNEQEMMKDIGMFVSSKRMSMWCTNDERRGHVAENMAFMQSLQPRSQ